MAAASETTFNISDLDCNQRIKLLHEFWKRQKPAVFFRLSARLPPSFDKEEAKLAVFGYIDYFCGRAIKMNFGTGTIDGSMYLRDTPKETAFQDAINAYLES